MTKLSRLIFVALCLALAAAACGKKGAVEPPAGTNPEDSKVILRR